AGSGAPAPPDDEPPTPPSLGEPFLEAHPLLSKTLRAWTATPPVVLPDPPACSSALDLIDRLAWRVWLAYWSCRTEVLERYGMPSHGWFYHAMMCLDGVTTFPDPAGGAGGGPSPPPIRHPRTITPRPAPLPAA